MNLLSSKLPQLSHEEMQKMFQPILTDVRKTRFYQDVAEEVGQKKAQKIAKALLRKK
jgi:predicted transposase YdaD